VKQFMDNGVPHTTATYLALLQYLGKSSIRYRPFEEGSIQLGSVTLRVLPPPESRLGTQNDNSIGILVEYGGFRALLTGDSETEEINHWLDRGVPDVTVLKAAHHGARDAVTPAWLAATRPEVVVISCGSGNSFGHPDPWALRYYSAVAKEIFRTDINGTVTVRGFLDGSYEIHVERELLP
jgi:beta-lactamase superfamily II metal-dependent hydrolase